MKYFYKYIVVCLIVFVLTSCSGLKPVYNNADLKKISKEIIILPAEGRYGTILRNELVKIFNSENDSDNKNAYIMKSSVNVSHTTVQAFNTEGTASRYRAIINVKYAVYDRNKCKILSGNNQTVTHYNSKGGGYDYGNIHSERESVKKNIEYNIRQIYPLIYNSINDNLRYKKKNLPFLKNSKDCIATL